LSLAIVTIHKGKFADLLRTTTSVDLQKKKPLKHIVVARNLELSQLKSIKAKYRIVIHNQDKSIYNAMNIGLKLTTNNYLLFLNSGDSFVNNNIISCIFNFIKKEKRCLIFKTQIVYKNRCYFPKYKFFTSGNYLPHPSFIRPPIKRVRIYKFNENLKIISDGIWMKKNLKKYDYKKIDKIITKHYIGGVSSVPSLNLIQDKAKVSFWESFKECIKLILYYILKDKYFYQIILKNNFDRK